MFAKHRISEKLYRQLKDENNSEFLAEGDAVSLVSQKSVYGNMYYYKKEICCFCFVAESITYLDYDGIDIRLNFSFNGIPKSIVISRKIFSSKELDTLIPYGFSYDPEESANVIRYLIFSESIAKKVKKHKYLGWDTIDGKQLFKLNNCVGYDSMYDGRMNLQSKGTLDDWINVVRDEVQGNTYMEIVLAMAFSPIFLPVFKPYIKLESLIYSLCGDSSRGKSTAQYLAASVYSTPELGKGVMKSWLTTPNSMINTLAGHHGVCFCFDESTINSTKRFDYTSIVYATSQGKDKERMTTESKDWDVAIISSGEASLINSCNENTGIRARIVELNNVFLTKNAENAQNICRGVFSNYGHAGKDFVNVVLNSDLDDMIDSFYYFRDKFLGKIEKTNVLTDRTADKYALLLFTCFVINQIFGLNFNIDNMMRVFLELENSASQKVDLAERALERLQEYYISHQGLFDSASSLSNLTMNAVGKDLGNGWVAFSKNIFIRILNDNQFSDYSIVCDKFKERGLLRHEKNRLTKRVMINKINVSCFVINIK